MQVEDAPIKRSRPDRPKNGLAPLKRRPKELEEDPTVFQAASSGGGMTLQAKKDAQGGKQRDLPGAVATGFTDEQGTLSAGDLELAEVEPAVRSRARQIAARLAIPRPHTDETRSHGSADLVSLPYRGDSDELDLDRTIESLAENPFPEDEDIVVREWTRTKRSVVLCVDVSGSMKGERVRTAAATVGALSSELQRDSLGVIAFWSDAAILLPLGAPVRPMELLDTLLRLPARGLTNIGFPLELAAQQLAGAPARDSRVVLLSDCVHNAGPDPRPLAARLPRLDVLLDASGEHDTDLARDLARMGRGRLRVIRDHRDVAPALSEFFA